MDEKRQVQKELFDEFVNAEKRRHPKNLFGTKPERTISLLYEHMIFMIIGIIIITVIIFSVGVEKGKRIGMMEVEFFAKDAKQEAPEKIEDLIIEEKQEIAIAEDKAPVKKQNDEIFSGYTIQVASYTKEDTAKARAQELKKNGHEAFTLHKGDFYILCIGRLKDEKQADDQA